MCREFARVGLSGVPWAKVIAKIAKLMTPEVVEQIHQRIVAMAKQAGAVNGRRLRVDTTVVETNIHYPTDSSLLGDGARVLTRLMKKVETTVGGLAQGVRDRMRTVKKKVVAIAISSRRKGPEGEKQRRQLYQSEIHRLKAVALVTGYKPCSGQRPAGWIPHQAGFKK